MRRAPAVSAAVLLLVSTASGQTVSEPVKPKVAGVVQGVKDDDPAVRARVLKKLYRVCQETGECGAYIKEKKRANEAAARTAGEKEGKITASSRSRAGAPAASVAVPIPVAVPDAAPAGDSSGAGLSGGSAPGAVAPTPERDAELSRDAERRRESVVNRAAGEADAMRRSFFPEDEGATGPGASSERDGARPLADREAGPAREENRELAVAALTGFGPTFRDQGLKVGTDSGGARVIQRLDGSAATKEDLAALRAALKEEPLALQRRPDFFKVLPRETFSDLKQDYARRPELRPTFFKDIAMTPSGRDFRWSASCGGVSGGCNPYVSASSYRQGQDVPPEDLKEVWQAVQTASLDDEDDEEYEDDEDGFGDYTDEDRRLAEAEDLAAKMNAEGLARARGVGALFARLGAMARSLGESLSEPGSAAAPAGAPAGTAVASRGVPAPVRDERRAAGDGGASTAGAPRAAVPREAPPVPDGPRAAKSRSVYPAAALLALVLLASRLRRKA